MPESYPFPMYSGLLEPKHYKRIGSALWLFAWFISSTTREEERDGITWGMVLGNKPLKLSELAEPFSVEAKTIRRWLKTLEQHEYITVKRAPYGLIIQVRKSKKYIERTEENVRSPSQRVDRNVRSVGERMDISVQSQGSEWTEMSTHPDKNVHSNKDITKIFDVVVIKDPNEIFKRSEEVAQHFVQRRGKGFDVSPADFDEIKQLVAKGVPLPVIKDCIDKSFAEFRPRHARDEIRSISYCIPRCYNEWYKMQDGSITENVPSEPVTLGHSSRKRSKAEEELEQLRREKEEAKRRAGVGS